MDSGMSAEQYFMSRPVHKTERAFRIGVRTHRYPNQPGGGIGLNPVVFDWRQFLALGAQQTTEIVLLDNGIFRCGAPDFLILDGVHQRSRFKS